MLRRMDFILQVMENHNNYCAQIRVIFVCFRKMTSELTLQDQVVRYCHVMINSAKPGSDRKGRFDN